MDRQIMETNYFGAVALTKALLPSMISRRSGDIVVTFTRLGDQSAEIGLPFRIAGPGSANIYRVEGEMYIRMNALQDPIREALEAAGVIVND